MLDIATWNLRNRGMLTLRVTSALLLIVTAFFALPANAQQLDKPDTLENFPTGDQPFGLCSDGSNIWVVNLGDDNVTKMRAIDGVVLGAHSPSAIVLTPMSLTVPIFGSQIRWIAQ